MYAIYTFVLLKCFETIEMIQPGYNTTVSFKPMSSPFTKTKKQKNKKKMFSLKFA